MTSFHHQPEAQHPKSSAIHNNAGRLPHLLALSGHRLVRCTCLLFNPKQTLAPLKKRYAAPRSHFGRSSFIQRESLRKTFEDTK